jgi:CoA:oxalate CoA-transferase
MSEALDCEHSAARRMTVEADDRGGRATRVLNSPYRFSAADAGLRGVPAFRGEDNSGVLSELLGMDDDEIAALCDAGVLSARVPGREPG